MYLSGTNCSKMWIVKDQDTKQQQFYWTKSWAVGSVAIGALGSWELTFFVLPSSALSPTDDGPSEPYSHSVHHIIFATDCSIR